MAIAGTNLRSPADLLATNLMQWAMPVGIIILWETTIDCGVIPPQESGAKCGDRRWMEANT
jgi:hypothetical protein